MRRCGRGSNATRDLRAGPGFGALALGAFAIGAVAIGAIAIARIAIGRLTISSARIRNLEIENLTVRRLRVLEDVRPEAGTPADEINEHPNSAAEA